MAEEKKIIEEQTEEKTEEKKKAKKKYFKLSERRLKSGATKKIITIDDEVKPTERDLADVKMYVSCGYEIAHKSKERAEKARERAKKNGFGKKKAEETTEE